MGADFSLSSRAAFLRAASAASAVVTAAGADAACVKGARPVVRGNSLDAFSLSWLTCFFLTGDEVALPLFELLLVCRGGATAVRLGWAELLATAAAALKALGCSVVEIKLIGASLKLRVSFLLLFEEEEELLWLLLLPPAVVNFDDDDDIEEDEDLWGDRAEDELL